MTTETSSQSSTPGPFAFLKRLGRTALDVLYTRLDLLVAEIAEEQRHLAELLLYAALAFFCLFLAVAVVAAFVVASFWDTPYRLLATGLTTVVLAIAGVACAITGVRKAQAQPKLFGTSLAEVGADLEHLK